MLTPYFSTNVDVKKSSQNAEAADRFHKDQGGEGTSLRIVLCRAVWCLFSCFFSLFNSLLELFLYFKDMDRRLECVIKWALACRLSALALQVWIVHWVFASCNPQLYLLFARLRLTGWWTTTIHRLVAPVLIVALAHTWSGSQSLFSVECLDGTRCSSSTLPRLGTLTNILQLSSPCGRCYWRHLPFHCNHLDSVFLRGCWLWWRLSYGVRYAWL